jgi:hypothetical protein
VRCCTPNPFALGPSFQGGFRPCPQDRPRPSAADGGRKRRRRRRKRRSEEGGRAMEMTTACRTWRKTVMVS